VKILERKQRTSLNWNEILPSRNSPKQERNIFSSLGIWLITLRMIMKLGAAPLHIWVPDVLIGA
jgi:NADH:ubiquinone oxidoreductase subunit 2 (subunit N)